MEIRSIYLLLSPNCNLSCVYCFQERGSRASHAAVAEKSIIDRFISFCIDNGVEHIEFFGGEPLLHRDTFIYSARQIRDRMPAATTGVVTNGTRIDEQTMSILEENSSSILLSMDGSRKRHNTLRGGYEKIERWFGRLTRHQGTSVALQAGYIEGLADSVTFLWDLGFTGGVYINILQNYGWYTREDIRRFDAEYESLIKAMLQKKGVLNCALQLHDIIKKDTHPRGCGIMHKGFACDWNGNIYPCHRAMEIGTRFVIGNVFDGVNKRKNDTIREMIRQKVSESQSWKEFPLVSYCPVSVYQKSSRFDGLWSRGFSELIMGKIRLVAKYFHEIEDWRSARTEPKEPRSYPTV